ncbi:outer membrane beta-barrel protein [Myroides albus]|uniref:Outer membrane beta-barrel protein n=1 Tax=Myroides albus TaxID=2562892 RepID=A0A6I3LIV8_9FLAO|nr:outer membrane beta-barrel protein [Myroides albus]MTG97747.1 outer membrane beta-barrel protein [Myroides albus]UVD78704.1 outer membrane beta-barrel protein [Myroides albus]
MKKLVLSVMSVVALGMAANAQEVEKPNFGFKEGDIMLEGSFQISDKVTKPTETNEGKEKFTNYTVNPKVGYFISDKVAVGASVAFGKSHGDFADMDQIGDAYSKDIYAGAFARYYFLELGKRFKTYAEVGVGFAENKNDFSKEKLTGIKAGLDLGFNYFVTENLAVAFTLGNVFSYSNQDMKSDGKKIGSVSETNANLNIFDNFFDQAKFGLIYKF